MGCGIGAIIHINYVRDISIYESLVSINLTQKHRGRDEAGIYINKNNSVGLCNARLSIIGTDTGKQPMTIGNITVVFNGEIYNHVELRKELSTDFTFKTDSDTEILIKLYIQYGFGMIHKIKGMFAFILYDEDQNTIFAARDRFGIKPFYYTIQKDTVYIASECKALLQFFNYVEPDKNALKEYLTFQYILGEKTLFSGIKRLLPGHTLIVSDSKIAITQYWKVEYKPDYNHTKKYFIERLRHLIQKSVEIQCRTDNDKNVGAYCSGGIDSSIISVLARKERHSDITGYHGRFTDAGNYDESKYARLLADYGIKLNVIDITANDFVSNIENIIYYMDYPEAGIGVFPQYIVSREASKDVKVMLGGQGGDELFGGYVRYLIAYFEQCLKGAIDGNQDMGKFIVTYESMIPNLSKLRGYIPMMQSLFRKGLFGNRDERYFALINRFPDNNFINDEYFAGTSDIFETFSGIYHSDNVQKACFFDEMTHYDINTSLRALLHVEDRVSMAHTIESRVPFLDYELFEFIATIPADIKFHGGDPKHILKEAYRGIIPDEIINRTDKMGFPVPFQKWMKENKQVQEFVFDIFNSYNALNRPYIQTGQITKLLNMSESEYGRNLWGLLCLELWFKKFIDL